MTQRTCYLLYLLEENAFFDLSHDVSQVSCFTWCILLEENAFFVVHMIHVTLCLTYHLYYLLYLLEENAFFVVPIVLASAERLPRCGGVC